MKPSPSALAIRKTNGEKMIARVRYMRLRTFARDVLFKDVIRIISNPP
ncbi:hypothetical protein [Methanosarcina sp.]